jgi:hypothetical protein
MDAIYSYDKSLSFSVIACMGNGKIYYIILSYKTGIGRGCDFTLNKAEGIPARCTKSKGCPKRRPFLLSQDRLRLS